MASQHQRINPWVAAARAAGPGVKSPRSSPTYIYEYLAARESLTLNEELVLAIRSARARSGLSQRAYAALRGWSSTHVSRLETTPTAMRINDVLAALSGSEYVLVLAHVPGDAPTAGTAQPVPLRGHTVVSETHWPLADVLAKTIDNKRFPAHRAVRRTDGPAWYERHFLTWLTWLPGPQWTTERRLGSHWTTERRLGSHWTTERRAD